MKHLQIDVVSVGRQSCDSKDWGDLGSNKSQARKIRLGAASVKSKDSRDRRGEIHSQMERKASRKNTKPHD